MLDAEELSPALRAEAGEYQTAVAEPDREIAAETATLKGRTAVGKWRGGTALPSRSRRGGALEGVHGQGTTRDTPAPTASLCAPHNTDGMDTHCRLEHPTCL